MFFVLLTGQKCLAHNKVIHSELIKNALFEASREARLNLKTITTMKIIQKIHIHTSNIETLKTLECVERIEQDHNGLLVLHIRKSCTKGVTIARSGDWLVQYSNGQWQRFGASAFNLIITT